MKIWLKVNNNQSEKKLTIMLNENNFANAQNLLNSLGGNKKVKRIRKEAGLIERTQLDNEKIILTEDNRQVLFG